MGEQLDDTRKKLSMVKKALLQEREEHKRTQIRLLETEKSLSEAQKDLFDAVSFTQKQRVERLEQALLSQENETTRLLSTAGVKVVDRKQDPVPPVTPTFGPSDTSALKTEIAELHRKLEALQTEHLMVCKSNVQLSDKNARLEEDLEAVRTELKEKKVETELKEIALKGK